VGGSQMPQSLMDSERTELKYHPAQEVVPWHGRFPVPIRPGSIAQVAWYQGPQRPSPPVPVPLWHAFSIPDSFKRLVKCFGSNPKPNGPLICPRAASAIQCQVGLGGMVRE
jgi:hypothetical protein